MKNKHHVVCSQFMKILEIYQICTEKLEYLPKTYQIWKTRVKNFGSNNIEEKLRDIT